jgi:hypothetical protein
MGEMPHSFSISNPRHYIKSHILLDLKRATKKLCGLRRMRHPIPTRKQNERPLDIG